MLFLTYIQGQNTTEWVHTISDWLEQVVNMAGEYNPQIWDNTELAFNRKFGDAFSQEQAITELDQGIKMENGNLDGFINKFDLLVHHAGYNPDERLALQKFTAGLPNAMYESIYKLTPRPVTYDQWKQATLEQQKMWVHLRGWLDQFKKPKPNLKPTWKFPKTFQPTYDPDAMDTSQGRAKARVAEISDFKPGGNRWKQSINNPAYQQNRGPREVICYNCNQPGHIACNCPQKPFTNPRGSWRGSNSRCPQQGPSCARYQDVTEEEQPTAQAITNDQSAQEKVQDWLAQVVDESEDIKNCVLQEIMGMKEGF